MIHWLVWYAQFVIYSVSPCNSFTYSLDKWYLPFIVSTIIDPKLIDIHDATFLHTPFLSSKTFYMHNFLFLIFYFHFYHTLFRGIFNGFQPNLYHPFLHCMLYLHKSCHTVFSLKETLKCSYLRKAILRILLQYTYIYVLVKICYKLLHVIQEVKIFNFLASVDIKVFRSQLPAVCNAAFD